MSEDISLNSFDEIKKIFKSFPSACEKSEKLAKDRDMELTKPPGALGKLEELAFWLSAWQAKHPATITRPRVAVFAGNHGVADQGVSAFPKEVTAQMVMNFQNGGACVNQLCKQQDAELRVYEMGLDNPTKDFTKEPAMTEQECVNAISYGMTTVEPGIDVLCVGEMGIANTTSGAAMAYALFGGEAEHWTGPGTGVAGDALSNKIRVVEEGVNKHKDSFTIDGKVDGLKVLQHLGGFELCAILGAIIAGRMANVPVIVDGYTTSVVASILHSYDKSFVEHCLVSHLSAEPSHIRLLDAMEKQPLIDFNMRLGEGSGAVLALGVLRSAINCHNGMATFAEAMVSNKD
ncbi:MAG: nicotinate-nucleotide--dimethylbenzimidazole phosphoribosyltransferase [Alphaproteobacteria bacterium]